MPKRRSSGIDRSPKRWRQHLYLVFDDSLRGYSIRKIDLSSDFDSDDSEEQQHPHATILGAGAELHLPPAVLRLEAPRGLPHYFAAAFGTRIMAMHPMKLGTDGKVCLMSKLLVPIFDVRTRGVIFGPRHKEDLADPIYIPVRDRLFALASGSFEQLWPPPLEHPGGEHWVWAWHELPEPPFERQQITSYAVHPDGRTIIVSTAESGGAVAATFALDTEAPDFVWKRLGKWVLPFTGSTRLGKWVLPFTGSSHFDGELDAFVGLSKDTDTLGYLCSCDTAGSDTGEGHCPPPAWKLSKEKLFGDDRGEKHEGATLLYLGGKSRFCLVQFISIQDGCLDEEVQEEDVPGARRNLLRLTIFSLSYDKNGDLTTGKSRRVRYYKVPKASTEFLLKKPVAFWL